MAQFVVTHVQLFLGFKLIKMIRAILLCFICISTVNSYKILGVFPLGSKSHYYVGHALMKGLALDGHEVTVISPFRVEEPISNYTEVYLNEGYNHFLQGNQN